MKAQATGSLQGELLARLASTGPLPFSRFMEAALYHPRFGYYASRVPGYGGDYQTSPTVSGLFGTLVARELRRMWEALGRPSPFWVIEPGAGLAGLAASAIEAADTMAGALRWRFVERFERVRRWQARRLGEAASIAEWSATLAAEPVTGCVLANEVLDNFPVHLFEVAAGGPAGEVYVDAEDGRLVERLGPVSEPGLAGPAAAVAARLAPGARFELCPALDGWLQEAAAALTRGYLVLVDYGDVEPALWREHPVGTIATHGPAWLSASWLEDPGGKDITAGVNFSAVLRAAAAAGFVGASLCSQADWLLDLGLAEVSSHLELAGWEAALAGRLDEAARLQSELTTLLGLADPAGLGVVQVFRAAKDAPAPCPVAARPGL
jgi:SAM-dependent MidA family methyltransferase